MIVNGYRRSRYHFVPAPSERCLILNAIHSNVTHGGSIRNCRKLRFKVHLGCYLKNFHYAFPRNGRKVIFRLHGTAVISVCVFIVKHKRILLPYTTQRSQVYKRTRQYFIVLFFHFVDSSLLEDVL